MNSSMTTSTICQTETSLSTPSLLSAGARQSERSYATSSGSSSGPTVGSTRFDLLSAILLGVRSSSDRKGIDHVIDNIHVVVIKEALSYSYGNKTRAAALLKVNRTTLVERMRHYGMPLNTAKKRKKRRG